MCGKQYVGPTTEKFRFRWNNKTLAPYGFN